MRFVIGQTDNPEAEMSLQEEIEEFGPMLRLPIKDTYTGLPWKTHSFVVTVYRLYNPKFIVKVDDDLYVRWCMRTPLCWLGVDALCDC